MAKRITELVELTVTPALDDLFTLVDVSEASPLDQNKKIKWETLLAGIVVEVEDELEPWVLDGNTLTGEKFIGTVSNHRFPMRTNNVEQFSIETSGAINRNKAGVTGLYSIHLTDATNTSWGLGALGAVIAGGGTGNVGIGTNALANTAAGSSNTAVGTNALRDNTTGNSCTAIGTNAGLANTTGVNNIFIQGGQSNVDGYCLTIIGTGADVDSGSRNTAIALGQSALITANNQIVIGASSFPYNQEQLFWSATGIHGTFYRTTTPEGAQAAQPGSICYTDESGVGKAYLKTSGTGNTGWEELGVGGGGAYTDEQAQDAVGNILVDSASINFTYTDATPEITAVVIANTTVQKIEVVKNSGAVVGTRKQLNFIEGSNVTLTIADDGGNDQVDITIASSGGAYTDEQAQDAIGAMVSAEFTYTDATPLLEINSIAAAKITGTKTAAFISDFATAVAAVDLSADYLVTDTTSTQNGFFNDVNLFRAGFYLALSNGGGDTATRTLSIDVLDADRALTIAGDATISGTNTGDQTSIVGITGTKAQFNTAVTDGDFLFVGDVVGLSDGDKGDITVSSSGTVWTIDNDAVTYAKIQNVSATDRILGRSTAGAGDIEEITCTAFARSILDDANAAAVIATLGLDADLATFAVPASTTISAFGATLVDDADATAARSTLGLVIGTNVQAFDATLLSIAALGTAADKMIYTTGVDTWAEAVSKDVAIATYAGTATFDGTAPTTITSQEFTWFQYRGMVTLEFAMLFTNAGATNTQVTFTWPSGVPEPAVIGSFGDAANEVVCLGVGAMRNSATQLPPASRCAVHRNAGNTAFEITIIQTSIPARAVNFTVTFRAA